MLSCSVCKKTDLHLFTCEKCKNKIYCGENCQRQDWKNHKRVCAEVVVLKPSKVPQFPQPSMAKPKVQKQPQKKAQSKAFAEFEDGLLKWGSDVNSFTTQVDAIWQEEMARYGVSTMAMEASAMAIKDVRENYNRMITSLLDDSPFAVENLIESVQNFTTLMYTGANLDIEKIAEREIRTQDQFLMYTLADAVLDVADSVADIRGEDNDLDLYVDEMEAMEILKEEDSEKRIGDLITFFKNYIGNVLNAANQCMTNEEYEKTMNDQWNKNRRARRKQQQKLGNVLVSQMLEQIPKEQDRRKKSRMSAYIDRILDRVNKYREEGQFLEYNAIEIAFQMSVQQLVTPLDDNIINALRQTLLDQFESEKDTQNLIRYDDVIAAFDDVVSDLELESQVVELKSLFLSKLRNYTKGGKWRNTYKWFSIIFQAVGTFFAILVAKKIFTFAQDQFKGSVDAMIDIFKETVKKTEASKILLEQARKDLELAKESAPKLLEAREKLVPLIGADTNTAALVENLGLQESKALTLNVLKARQESVIGIYGELEPPRTPDGELQIFNQPTTMEEMDTLSIELMSIQHQANRVAQATTPEDLIRQIDGVRAGIQGSASVAFGHDTIEYQQDVVRQSAIIARCQNNVAAALQEIIEMENLQVSGKTSISEIAEAQKYISTHSKFLDFVRDKTESETIASLFDAHVAAPFGVAERVFRRIKADPVFSIAIQTLGSRGIGTAASIAQFLGKWGGSVFVAFLQIQQIFNIGQILGYTIGGIAWSIDKLTATLQSLIFPNFGDISLTEQLQLINAGVPMSKTAKGLWFTTSLIRLLTKMIEKIAFGFAGCIGIIQWYGTLILAIVSAASFLYTAITGSLSVALFSILATGAGLKSVVVLSATGLYAVVYTLALFLWKFSPNYYYPIMIRARFCLEATIRISVGGIIGYSAWANLVSAIKSTLNTELNIKDIWGL